MRFNTIYAIPAPLINFIYGSLRFSKNDRSWKLIILNVPELRILTNGMVLYSNDLIKDPIDSTKRLPSGSDRPRNWSKLLREDSIKTLLIEISKIMLVLIPALCSCYTYFTGTCSSACDTFRNSLISKCSYYRTRTVKSAASRAVFLDANSGVNELLLPKKIEKRPSNFLRLFSELSC